MAVATYSSGHHKRSIFKTHLSTDGQQQCYSSGCSAEFAGGSTLSLESDAKFTAAAGSTMNLSGSVNVKSGGNVDVESGGGLRLAPGSSMDQFGITRQMTSVSVSSAIILANHGFSHVHFGTSGKWVGYLLAPTSGVEKTILVSFSTMKKSEFRLNLGASGGSKIGIGSTMRHSIYFTSHAQAKTTAGGRGTWVRLLGISATRWMLTGEHSTAAANVAITSATHPG